MIVFDTQLDRSESFDIITEDVTLETLRRIYYKNHSCRGYTQGYLAEDVLEEHLKTVPELSNVYKIQDSNPDAGDIRLTYRDEIFTVECKSIRTGTVKFLPRFDTWSGRVEVKHGKSRLIQVEGLGQVSSQALKRETFADVLGISCFAVNGRYEFLFMDKEHIPDNANYPGYIPTSFVINPVTRRGVRSNLLEVLDSIIAKRQS